MPAAPRDMKRDMRGQESGQLSSSPASGSVAVALAWAARRFEARQRLGREHSHVILRVAKEDGGAE